MTPSRFGDDVDDPVPPTPPAPMPVVHDKPWYRRSAFYKMVTAILTASVILFPGIEKEVKFAIIVLENVAIFFVIDRLSYSPDPKEFVQKGGVLLERDGQRARKTDVLGKDAA